MNTELLTDILSKLKSLEKRVKQLESEKTERWKPPELSEVKSYCAERNNTVDPVKWYDFYKAKNWMIGKNKMKDWQAAVRTWEDKTKNDTVYKKNRNNIPDGYGIFEKSDPMPASLKNRINNIGKD